MRVFSFFALRSQKLFLMSLNMINRANFSTDITGTKAILNYHVGLNMIESEETGEGERTLLKVRASVGRNCMCMLFSRCVRVCLCILGIACVFTRMCVGSADKARRKNCHTMSRHIEESFKRLIALFFNSFAATTTRALRRWRN